MSARHRIALIGALHPYRGGIAHFTTTTYQGLVGRGHEVLPVTFSRQYPSLLFPGKSQLVSGTVEDPVPARRWIDTLAPWTWSRTGARIARWGADAVLFNYWMPFFAPAYGTILRRARKRGTRGIALVHNAIPHERRPGDTVLGAWFLRACDGFVVLSETVEQDLRRLGARGEIRRIQHPRYDIFGDGMPRANAREILGLPAEAPILLFFGYVRRYKGLGVLLQAMPAVRARIPNVRLVVAGEFYEDERLYRDRVRDLGIGDVVDLRADYIPDREVAAWFSAANVVVQPYVSATQSGVAQVAFQFGRPVILTDVGGLAEVVPHERAGLVVPPDDPRALASAIVRYFEEGLEGTLSEGVQAERGKYSWERLYESVEALLPSSAP